HAEAEAGHGLEELAEARRVFVEVREEVAALLGLVLRSPRPQGLRERAPEAIEACVRHLEKPADVRGLGAIEEEAGLGRVAVHVAASLEHAERHQRVEEVARAARVETEARAQRLALEGLRGEHGEDAELDGAEQHLRSPETGSELEEPIRYGFGRHRSAGRS